MIPILAMPMAAKLATVAVLVSAVFGGGMYLGNKIGKSDCLEATIEAQKHSIATSKAQTVVTDAVVTRHADAVKAVQGRSRKILSEVKHDRQMGKLSTVLSGDFRLRHDSAIDNDLPTTSGIADAAPVEVGEVAETIVSNYGICHENAETLTALQDWVRRQGEIK